MKDIVFSLGKNVRTVLRANMLSILIIHLVFITLGFILFTPLLGGLGRLLLSFSSQEVLADTDIIFFLLSPFYFFFCALIVESLHLSSIAAR